MNTNTKPGERPQVLGPSELVQALREKHAGGWRLSRNAAVRVVQEQYDFRLAAASEWSRALYGIDLQVFDACFILCGPDKSKTACGHIGCSARRRLEGIVSSLPPSPHPEAREDAYEIGTPREFAERLAWMAVNGKPDLDQWENHIKFRDAALSRLAAKEGQGQYSIEPHGNAYALYVGRDNEHHGLNLCRLSEFDAHGEATRTTIVRALNSADPATSEKPEEEK